ncbi:MAG TPA: lipid-A-disaccharide synthase [Nitrospirales bacterium]|nr:lipid-A-disaccharide synthase [Nitrospirales bacterium]
MPRILIVTGEASGDLHGAHLAEALRALRPDVELIGVGGARMAAAGVTLLPGIDRLDIMGLFGATQLGAIARTFATIARYLMSTKLDAVVFVDHPGMNLRLARVARYAGHRVIYYIAPQIWAWGARRLRRIVKFVDRMIVVLPFEVDLYRRAGLRCEYVGHPLRDEIAPQYDAAELRKRFGVSEAPAVIGLLPGSREREVRALLPVLLASASGLVRRHPGTEFLLAQAGTVPDALLADLTGAAPVRVRIIKDRTNDVMAACDLLLVASGTATLQAAVIGTPMVMLYRLSWPTYLAAQIVVRFNRIRMFHDLRCFGLVNLVAGRRIVPELIQFDATAANLVAEADRLWPGQPAADVMRRELRVVRDLVGEAGASRRAAALILAECGG